MSLKIENSRRVAKSHPVCMDLYATFNMNVPDRFLLRREKTHIF
jgi:hypothetical protein